jgi:hypothetical protein
VDDCRDVKASQSSTAEAVLEHGIAHYLKFGVWMPLQIAVELGYALSNDQWLVCRRLVLGLDPDWPEASDKHGVHFALLARHITFKVTLPKPLSDAVLPLFVSASSEVTSAFPHSHTHT